MEKSNIFKHIPKDLQDELFEDIISTDTLKIERIVSYGHTSPQVGWYESQLNEWVIVLEGEAILTFEDGGDVTLKVGDYLNIKALQKHKVSWTALDNKTVWLTIYY
ncbi:MAG: cupin domain-containing protein [Arcobacteraceae bacterium]|nr:cupin domain-containing protein [Arcobacteraceae bacterium]